MGVNLIIWGCVAADEAGHVAWINGIMDSSKCQQILQANVIQSEKTEDEKRVASTEGQ